MLSALKRFLMGAYARAAAQPLFCPYPQWTTGSGTDDDNRTLERRRAKWEKLLKPVTILWLEEIKLILYPGNEMSRVIFLTGLFEPNEFYWLSDFLRPGMTVIDGGANMGLYALFCARKVGPDGLVLAVEPSPREFGRLEHHVGLNHLKNVHTVKAALSGGTGKGELLIAGEWNAGHNTLGEFSYPDTQLAATETVALTTIDALVSAKGLKRVDFVKLDLEGAELAALEGSLETLRRFRPALLIEVSHRSLLPQGASPEQIVKFLVSLGYSLYLFDASCNLVPYETADNSESVNVIALCHDELSKFSRSNYVSGQD